MTETRKKEYGQSQTNETNLVMVDQIVRQQEQIKQKDAKIKELEDNLQDLQTKIKGAVYIAQKIIDILSDK